MAYEESPNTGGPPDADRDPGDGGTQRTGSKKYDSSLVESLALVGQLGFSVACPMVTFIAGGAWLDRQLNTVPWFLFVGVLLGLAVAAGLIIQINNLQTKRQAKSSGKAAPYKVDGQDEQVGTNRAVNRRRTRR